MIGGLFPIYSSSCRENPKILGVGNAFAAGIFMAIGLMHVIPEEIEAWAAFCGEPEKLFPLPELLAFAGYTIILILDKVLFDTHALFDDHDDGHGHADPADRKFQKNVRASAAQLDSVKASGHASKEELKASSA